MKLSASKIDPMKLEEGAWIGEKYGTPIPEMGELCLKLRGANNKSWRKLQGTLVRAVPRARRTNGLEPEDEDRINAVLLRDTSLLDWSGIEDEAGGPLAFSKAQAFEYLTNPEHVRFREGALWAANIVAEQGAAEIEEVVKNS